MVGILNGIMPIKKINIKCIAGVNSFPYKTGIKK